MQPNRPKAGCADVAAVEEQTAPRPPPRSAAGPALRSPRRESQAVWHGGAPGLPVGTVLVGKVEAARLGHDLTHYNYRTAADDPTRDDRVHLATNPELARTFTANTCVVDDATGIVAQHGDLYQVEPIGPLEVDPDNRTRISWQTTHAKVLAVAERNVSLDQYEVTPRAGPHACWSDGSPIYTMDGSYRRSPEQRAARFDHPIFQHLPSWTPLSYINAWIAGQPDASLEQQAPRRPCPRTASPSTGCNRIGPLRLFRPSGR